jgi:hypothetical protein
VVYRHMGQLNWQEVPSIEDLISQKPWAASYSPYLPFQGFT